jgi:hypothetical protein
MTDVPAARRPRGRSPWVWAGYWASAALGLPIMTIAWTSITLANEEDSEAARHGFAPTGPALLTIALGLIALAHLVGWGLLRGIAHGTPGGSRRHTTLAVWTVVAVSGVGLIGALLLTDGQLFLPYPRPYVP